MPLSVMASETVAARRRVFFQLVGTDGITPALGEAGGQPQVSASGAAWADSGIGVLSAVGNGRYYADLTAGAVASVGARVETRYKSASTAECPGDTVVVVAADPYAAKTSIDLTQTGLTPRALDAVADSALTVGDALVAAVSAAAGKEVKSGTAYTIKTPSTGTVIRTFTLNNATNPTSRT